MTEDWKDSNCLMDILKVGSRAPMTEDWKDSNLVHGKEP